MTTNNNNSIRIDDFYPLDTVLNGSCYRAGCWGCKLNNGWCRAIGIRKTFKLLHIIEET